MKWLCPMCRAINAMLAYVCHNCGLAAREKNPQEPKP